METIVIVLNWNGVEDTIAAIESLQNQSYDSSQFQIVVGDNRSEVLDRDRLIAYCTGNPHIDLYLFDENLGFGRAHNRLLDLSIEKYTDIQFVCLLNNDAVAERDWVEVLIMQAHQGHDLVACRMMQYADRSTIDNIGHIMLNTGEILPRDHGNKIKTISDTKLVGACGGAMLIRYALIERIGFFDPYFFVGYEDAELGYRALVNGATLGYVDDAIVYHKMSTSINKIRNSDYEDTIKKYIIYSWLKNSPLLWILENMPSVLLKQLLMLFVNIAALRFRMLQSQITLWIYILNPSTWTEIKKARKHALQDGKPSKNAYLRSHMICFLPFDIRRFIHSLQKKSYTI